MPVTKAKGMKAASTARSYMDGLVLGLLVVVSKTRRPIYFYEIFENALKLSQKGFMWVIQIESLLTTKAIRPKELKSVTLDPSILINNIKKKDWGKVIEGLDALIKYVDGIAESLDSNFVDIQSQKYKRAHDNAYSNIKETAFALIGLRVEIIQRAGLDGSK